MALQLGSTALTFVIMRMQNRMHQLSAKLVSYTIQLLVHTNHMLFTLNLHYGSVHFSKVIVIRKL
jgi:hypothetical protein